MHLLLNCWMQQLQTLQVHRSPDRESTGQHLCQGQGHIMYFPVNTYPPKLLDKKRALTNPHRCACWPWSALLLLKCNEMSFSHNKAHIMITEICATCLYIYLSLPGKVLPHMLHIDSSVMLGCFNLCLTTTFDLVLQWLLVNLILSISICLYIFEQTMFARPQSIKWNTEVYPIVS